jgi:alkanesulfonate monooxygenase SsuD/methylene tetrahydromethanopterin reductase-like flavin-dependent oxidoreductase (luciferase family)
MPSFPVSLAIFHPTPTGTLEAIVHAEQAGVPAVWVPSIPMGFDPLTLLSAAALRTSRIRLGTGIIPTYPKHPTALVSQALTMTDLAPGRFQLGIGPSHPFIIEGMYGMACGSLVDHTREYLTILRALLWEGRVSFSGTYYRVQAALPPGTQPPRIPLPVSALRAPMFRLIGELADGALTAWCPVPYLLRVALPAMRAGAEAAKRPVPPLIANVPIILETDVKVVRETARAALGMYLTAPAYLQMFARAGFPIEPGAPVPEALIDELFVYGQPASIASRLREIHAAGIDEIMVTFHSAGNPMADFATTAEIVGKL